MAKIGSISKGVSSIADIRLGPGGTKYDVMGPDVSPKIDTSGGDIRVGPGGTKYDVLSPIEDKEKGTEILGPGAYNPNLTPSKKKTSAEDYAEYINEAMNKHIEYAVRGLSFNKNEVVEIVDASKAKSGIYTVSNGSTKYTARSENSSYTVGTSVYVMVSNNDYSQEKWIIGRVRKDDDKPLDYVAPLDQIDRLTDKNMIEDIDSAIIPQIDPRGDLDLKDRYWKRFGPPWEWENSIFDHQFFEKTNDQYNNAVGAGLTANGNIKYKLLYLSKDLMSTEYNKGYQYLGLSANFKVLLGHLGLDRHSGRYGLILFVYYSYEVDGETKQDRYEVAKYKLDSEDMIGAVYDFPAWYNQQAVFKIIPDGIQGFKLQNIALCFYQDGNFTKGNELITVKDINSEQSLTDFGELDVPNEDNIFVKDIGLWVGNDKALKTDTTRLYCYNGLSYDSAQTNDFINVRKISLEWKHLAPDGSVQIIDNVATKVLTDWDLNFVNHVYWYATAHGMPSDQVSAFVEGTSAENEQLDELQQIIEEYKEIMTRRQGQSGNEDWAVWKQRVFDLEFLRQQKESSPDLDQVDIDNWYIEEWKNIRRDFKQEKLSDEKMTKLITGLKLKKDQDYYYDKLEDTYYLTTTGESILSKTTTRKTNDVPSVSQAVSDVLGGSGWQLIGMDSFEINFIPDLEKNECSVKAIIEYGPLDDEGKINRSEPDLYHKITTDIMTFYNATNVPDPSTLDSQTEVKFSHESQIGSNGIYPIYSGDTKRLLVENNSTKINYLKVDLISSYRQKSYFDGVDEEVVWKIPKESLISVDSWLASLKESDTDVVSITEIFDSNKWDYSWVSEKDVQNNFNFNLYRYFVVKPLKQKLPMYDYGFGYTVSPCWEGALCTCTISCFIRIGKKIFTGDVSLQFSQKGIFGTDYSFLFYLGDSFNLTLQGENVTSATPAGIAIGGRALIVGDTAYREIVLKLTDAQDKEVILTRDERRRIYESWQGKWQTQLGALSFVHDVDYNHIYVKTRTNIWTDRYHGIVLTAEKTVNNPFYTTQSNNVNGKNITRPSGVVDIPNPIAVNDDSSYNGIPDDSNSQSTGTPAANNNPEYTVRLQQFLPIPITTYEIANVKPYSVKGTGFIYYSESGPVLSNNDTTYVLEGYNGDWFDSGLPEQSYVEDRINDFRDRQKRIYSNITDINESVIQPYRANLSGNDYLYDPQNNHDQFKYRLYDNPAEYGIYNFPNYNWNETRLNMPGAKYNLNNYTAAFLGGNGNIWTGILEKFFPTGNWTEGADSSLLGKLQRSIDLIDPYIAEQEAEIEKSIAAYANIAEMNCYYRYMARHKNDEDWNDIEWMHVLRNLIRSSNEHPYASGLDEIGSIILKGITLSVKNVLTYYKNYLSQYKGEDGEYYYYFDIESKGNSSISNGNRLDMMLERIINTLKSHEITEERKHRTPFRVMIEEIIGEPIEETPEGDVEEIDEGSDTFNENYHVSILGFDPISVYFPTSNEKKPVYYDFAYNIKFSEYFYRRIIGLQENIELLKEVQQFLRNYRLQVESTLGNAQKVGYFSVFRYISNTWRPITRSDLAIDSANKGMERTLPIFYNKNHDVLDRGNISGTRDNKANNLSCPSFYLDTFNAEKLAIVAIVADPVADILEWNSSFKVVYTMPLIMLKNSYTIPAVNSWDGSLVIDKEGNRVMSAMMAAGHKDSQNRFTGTIMGDIVDLQGQLNTGLYGYHQGDKSFGFNVDGTAFIGKSTTGRIWFDGNNGAIQSGNYTATENRTVFENAFGKVSDNESYLLRKTGTKIDLTNGLIDMYGIDRNGWEYDETTKKMKLKRNQAYLSSHVRLSPVDPYFYIAVPSITNGKYTGNVDKKTRKSLIYVGQNDYYLQTADYNEGYIFNEDGSIEWGCTQGLKLDLQNGTLTTANTFKLKAADGSWIHFGQKTSNGSYLHLGIKNQKASFEVGGMLNLETTDVNSKIQFGSGNNFVRFNSEGILIEDYDSTGGQSTLEISKKGKITSWNQEGGNNNWSIWPEGLMLMRDINYVTDTEGHSSFDMNVFGFNRDGVGYLRQIEMYQPKKDADGQYIRKNGWLYEKEKSLFLDYDFFNVLFEMIMLIKNNNTDSSSYTEAQAEAAQILAGNGHLDATRFCLQHSNNN